MDCKVDFHCHTEVSMDSAMPLEKAVEAAKGKGISAMAICDHNSAFLPKEQPFEDFLLLSGCEYSTERGHILGILFGEIPAITRADYENGIVSSEQVIAAIHAAGGLAVWAHPFGNGAAQATLPAVDGVEVWNARACFKNPSANAEALVLAIENKCLQLGGSDAHLTAEVGNGYVVLALQHLTAEDVKLALLTGTGRVQGVRSKAIYKGKSQWLKRKKEGSPWGIFRGLLYVSYCYWKDIIEQLGK